MATALVTMGCGPADHEQAGQRYPSRIEGLAIHRDPVDPLIEAQTRGRDVFLHYCQICHGTEGLGDGFNSTNLAVVPRDFSDAGFWQEATDERLMLAISAGGTSVDKSVLMPAWGHTLSKQQIQDVIAHLYTVPEQAKRAEQAEEDSDSDSSTPDQ